MVIILSAQLYKSKIVKRELSQSIGCASDIIIDLIHLNQSEIK